MPDELNWRDDLLDLLSRTLRDRPDAKALILTGSLVAGGSCVDEWSDVDVKVVLSDEAIGEFFSSRDWLETLGVIVGLDRHDKPQARTLRVCFEPMRRMDITLIPESLLANMAAWERDLIGRPCAVVWSKIPRMEERLAAIPPGAPFAGPTDAVISDLADAFWFKASMSVAKLMRRDLLVASHLALDLLRDCLVLQMMRRDRERGTTVHRTGGFGNEIVERLWPEGPAHLPAGILDAIERSGRIFDELAADLSPSYQARAPRVLPALQRARQHCEER